MISWLKNNNRDNWLEIYLPFVSKSPKMKIKWLKGALKKKILSLEEITPYIRLLLQDNNVEEDMLLADIFKELNEDVQCGLLAAADIYDTPKLFRLCPHPTRRHVELALSKKVPPYEKKTQLVLDKVFYAISDYSRDLLDEAVRDLAWEGKTAGGFLENYERFQSILEDEEFLLSLYPNASG